MVQPHLQEQLEFAQYVRTTCHRLNNFFTILQCQHGNMESLSSSKLDSELAAILRDLEPLIDTATNDVLELSKECRSFMEGAAQPETHQNSD